MSVMNSFLNESSVDPRATLYVPKGSDVPLFAGWEETEEETMEEEEEEDDEEEDEDEDGE